MKPNTNIKRNMQSAWEVGGDKIVSSYRSNTLNHIILKHYKKTNIKGKCCSGKYKCIIYLLYSN